jgi:hypothetical protein
MRKAFALLLIFFLVFPLTVATLTTVAIRSWAIERSFYTRVVDDPRLYDLNELLPRQDGDVQTVNGFVDQGERVSSQAFAAALDTAVTQEYMRDQALSIVTQVFDFVDGRSTVLDITVDILPLKTALKGDAGPRFARTLAEALPVCAAAELPAATDGTIMACRPANVSVDEAAALILAQLPQSLDDIPDHVRLQDQPAERSLEARWNGMGTPSPRAAIDLTIAVLALSTLGVWLLAGLVAGDNAPARLQWLGWSLVAPAVLVLLFGIVTYNPLVSSWLRIGMLDARHNGILFSPAYQRVLLAAGGRALSMIATGFYAAGGIATALGVALVLWGANTAPHRTVAVAPVAPVAPVTSTAPTAPASESSASGTEDKTAGQA